MRAAKPLGRFTTVGDLIRELGVPARRVRLDPLPGTASESDLAQINDRKEGLCELIDGTLVEKAMGFRKGFLAALFIEFLGPFGRAKDLGIVVGPDSPMRLRRGLVRLPDVSFVSWDQVPNKEIPEESVPSLYPDLAIEIYSRNNTRKEMARKRREYFRAGCQLVWIVYPKTETVEVYTTPTKFTTLNIDGVLNGDHVLPGFKLPLRKIFSAIHRPTADNEKTK